MRTLGRMVCLALAAGACSGNIEGAGPGGAPGDTVGAAPAGGATAAGPGGVQPGTAPPALPTPAGASPASNTTPAAFAPAPGGLRRLTADEHRNSLRDLLGDVAAPTALEPDVVLFGFTTVGAASASVSERGVEQYEAAARDAAAQVFAADARRRALVGCAPAEANQPCVRTFLETFGRRAFRRPLAAAETDALLAAVKSIGAASGSVWTGLEHAVSAILQSPSFLYRIELGEPDPAARDRRRFTGFEMASRLSYLFWSTTPDDALLNAAASGELATADGVRAQARRLLQAPRGRQGLSRLFSELFELGKLAELQKDPKVFPTAPALGPHMRTEAERMIDNVIFGRAQDVRALLETDETFVNADLARLYGLPAPAGAGFAPVKLPANGPRAGVLGLAGVLALHAHGVDSSPTLRGKFVREVLLCQQVPPPPVDVVATLPPPRAGVKETHRQRLDQHRRDPACAGCHALMDPIGFGLERFDAIGAHRTVENGLLIDATGELDGRAFDGLRGLAAAVRAHGELAPCLVKTAYRFATGHAETAGEAVVLDGLASAFATSGYQLPELAVAIAASDGFRHAGDPR